MAIVIEEGRRPINVIRLMTWLVIVGLIIAAVYYIFFKQPTLVEITAPASIRNVEDISKLTFSPDTVTGSPLFNGLTQYVTPPQPVDVGRPNPFIPF